jgi:EmrB/QacA subfamily drug resistance transporter
MSQNAQVVLTGRKRWFALIFLALGVAMIILDATVVNVAIPTMIKDLGLSTTDAEWVTAAYSLTFASLLILAGRIADRAGRRLLFIVGLIVFVAASVLVAASDSALPIIGARALQGVGAAMLLPSSLSVINAVFVGKARAAAFAVWGGTIGGMAALGPLVGGWLTTYASWHWAFLINLPIGIIVLIGVLVFVPETKETSGPKGFDIPGTVLVTLGFLGVVFALIEGLHYGWITPVATFTIGSWAWPLTSVSIVLVAALLGIAALAVFIPVELHRLNADKVVVINLRLFKIRSFGAGNVVALVVSLGEFGLLFALPLFLQSVRGYDPLQTGVILLALAVGSFVASGAGAALAQRLGPVRVLQIGMLLEAVGIFSLAILLSVNVTGWQLAPSLFVYGMGVGFATAQLTGVILSEVPIAVSGQASAVQSTSRQVGAAIGTAIVGATLILGLGSVKGQLTGLGVDDATATKVADAMSSSAGQAYNGLSQIPGGDVLVQGAAAGFAIAIKLVAVVAGIFVLCGLVASFLLPRNAARVASEGYAPPKAE